MIIRPTFEYSQSIGWNLFTQNAVMTSFLDVTLQRHEAVFDPCS